MKNRIIDDVLVEIDAENVSEKQLEAVAEAVKKKNHDSLKDVQKIHIGEADAKNLNICVDFKKDKSEPKFERIRRITGYLVGTTDRWNDAKQAELKDRVKHA